MAKKKKKKKAAAVSADKPKKKKLTCIAFLREVFTNDNNISNEKVLGRLLKKFPNSKANVKSIITWKNMLRAEGIDIPKSKADPKKKKPAKSKAAKKKSVKKKRRTSRDD